MLWKEKVMNNKGFWILAGMILVGSSRANCQQLQVSEKYPLEAHIVSVEMEQQQIVRNGSGGTSTWHLMKS
jgi:hypothetical protein